MSYFENSRRTFTANAAIFAGCVVKLAAGKVEVCGESDQPLGFAETDTFGAGENVTVRLLNTSGTVEVRAGGSITAGTLVSPAASGDVQAHSLDKTVIGLALNAASSGEFVEIVPLFDRTVTA